ncbi:MAG: ABC transporter permease [Betaproteobacteria bacterium]
MFKLALRNIFRHRFRTAVTLAAIVFGVCGLVLSGGFVRDIFIQLAEALIHSQSGHLQVSPTGYFSYGSRSPEKYVIEAPDRLQAVIAAMPQVDDVLMRVHFSGLLNNGRTDWPIIGEGVQASKESKLSSFMHIVAGRQLTDADDFGALVGQGVAQALKLAPGDRVTVLLSTADGALNNIDLEVIGVFQSFSKDFDARAIRIPLKAAHELLGSQGVNTLVVSLKRTSDTERVAAALRATLPPPKFEVRTWVQLNDFYEKTIALYEQQFGFLQLIILAMVLLSVANSVNMSVFERVGEFGTMVALGNRARQVRGLIFTETAMVGMIGGLLGLALGIALALLISAIGIPMPPPPNANLGYTGFIRVVPGVLALAFAVGLAATLLAAILPAVRVSRMPVVDALRANV